MSDVIFEPWPKIARLSREIIVTEKIDGTNSQVFIRPATDEPLEFGIDTQIEVAGVPAFIRAGSRSRWLQHGGKGDNFGFGAWVTQHAPGLAHLGFGRHYGEWWGHGIQRGYNQPYRFFSLFNTSRWSQADSRPACCGVVPILYMGAFDTSIVDRVLANLRCIGSAAAPGFMHPEGVVVYHVAGNLLFKKTLEKDEEPKGVKR